MEEKSKLFYDDLVGTGYKLPDYETFKTSLQDQSKADAFYKDLSSSGFKLPDFDTFYGVFKPADTTQVALQPVVEQPAKEAQSTLSNVLGSVNQAFFGVPGDILELTAMGSALAERGLAKLGVPGADPNIGAEDVNILGMKSLNPMRASKEWKEAIANASPVDQEFKESFVGGVSQGFGQLFSMLASGGSSAAPQIAKMSLKTGTNLTPVIAAGKELVGNAITKPGLIGGATNAAASYHQAKQEGATEEEALQFGIENFGVGLVFENLPIQKMLSRVAKIDPNSTMITRMVKGGAQAFTEEFLTEELQSLYSDMSAQRIYDENRKLLEDIGYEGTVGGTVGFLANTMLTALAGRRAKIKSPEEAEVLDKAIEETETVVNKIDSKNKKIEETVTALENTKSRTLNNGATDLEFIENPDGSIELAEDGLTAPDAESKKLLLERKYPNVEFQIVDNTDKKDPYAESNFTIVGRPKTNAKYSKGQDVLSKNQAQFLIEGATTVNELEGLNIENDPELQAILGRKVKELTPVESEAKAKTISDMAGESVSVRIGDQNISGIVEVDEGGKATITQGDTIYEIPKEAEFTEFVRPVEIGPEGDFVVNGDSFSEARIIVEDGQPKALLIRPDGTTKAITNPRVVEEIEYQITLAQLDNMSDEEADQMLESYDKQRQTEATTEEGIAQTDETEDDRKLREATEEIQLIEDLALLELEDIETQAKLVEFTPPTMKEPKIYLVKKNPDGSYIATLNGRKVARPEIIAELGKLFEQKTGEDISKLQEQTNKLKQEVEQKLFPNASSPKQQTSTEPAGERQTTPKAIPQESVNQGVDNQVQVKESKKLGKNKPLEVAKRMSGSVKELDAGFGDKGYNYKTSEGVEVTLKDDHEGGSVNDIEVQADFMLDFIGVDENRGQGLASKEIDKILELADKENLSVSLVVDSETATTSPQGVKTGERGLSNDQLKDWYKRKGFIFDSDSRYGYRPKKSENRSNFESAKFIAKEGDVSSEEDVIEFFSDKGTMLDWFRIGPKEEFIQDPKTKREKGFYESGEDKIYYWDGQKLLPVPNVSVKWDKDGYKFKTLSESQEPTDKGADREVPITTKQDGKTKQKTTPGKSPSKKDDGRPKVRKPSQKGRVPLDQRALKGKEAQAARLIPNTIQESVLSWFINGGRLSYGGLQSLFGQQKQGFKKSIQGEFNARRSYMRTPEKGGKSLDEIAQEILDNLPESLEEKAQSDPTALRNAIERVISENSSVAQMANSMLSGRGIDSKASKQLPPVEDRSRFTQDAIRETFTPEEWADMSSQEKADFFNEYFQYPKGSEYEYTAEMIEESEGVNFENDQREDDIDFLSVMSNDELVEFEKGYKGVEAEFAPEGTKIDTQKQKVKDLANDLIRQIKEDKQGIIVDFEAKAKADIKFFNTLRNLVIEYARLKGLQFNEFIADLQKLLGQEIDKTNREYLKTLWDAEKKATPKKNVMTENKSLTKDEKVKQGLEELIASKERDAKLKLERERAKADERVKAAKDKGKEALAQFENIKNTMVEFIKMDLKDIPVDSFTKGELNKILTQINRARTDWSLNLAIGKAYDILGESGKKKRISVAKEKVSQAKKNIKAGKIGVLQPNSPLDQMLRINPKIIPQRIFDEYESILGEVGARKTVLSPSERSVLFRRVSEVMKEVDKDNSLLNSLKYEYDNFEDKGETYSETLTRMLKEDIISEEEMEFMKLRKSEIQEKPETEKAETSQEELDEAIDSILDEIPNLPQPGNNFSKDENKIIRFFNSLKEADLQGLTLKDLSSIYSLMGNLENNYVPHLAEKLRQKIEGTRNAKVIQPITKGFKGKWSDILSRTKAGIKNKFMQDETTSMRERIRMNPLAYIDQSLRNFKNTLFYDSTFRKLASAYSAFDSDFKTVLEKLLKAESGLKNQFESRAKMMMMAIQEEFESNPGAKVHSAKDWLDATIADKYSIYTADSKRKLKELFDSLSTNGEFDLKKAEKSLSKEERAARKAIEEINNYLTPIADWTATVIRGNRVPIHENYIHLPRKVKGGQPTNFDPKTMGGPLNPSTKSGALIERTGKTHAISFDVFDNVLSGAKQTLMDYHLTPAVREMNQTFSQLESMAESDSEVEAATQISKIYEESLKNTVGVSMAEENLPDAIFNEVARKGYQAILSGVGKSISEFTSNSIFAGMFKLDATTNGIKILSNLKPDKSSAVVKNVGSTHSSRLYNTSGMDSKHTEFAGYNTKKLAKVSGVDESVVSRLVNVAKDNKWYRTVDSIQSTLMSSPDQVVARPLWMGVFNQAFIRETNQDPDFDKIAANDQEYMDQYSEAIDIARNEADDTVTEAVASANPFDGILKNTQAPGGSAIGKYLNTFNSFMTRFAVYEYNSAVRGVNALVGNGKMSKADGAKLLGALTVRLMFYDLMTETLLGLIYQSIAGLFSDQKEEEKEDLEDILSRSFVSSMIMLTLNRNMGNVAKTPINYAVELANKEFGEGVTYTGEYDPFTSSVVYPLIPVEIEPGSKGIPQMLVENTSASMMPLTKTAFRTMTVAHRALTSKTDEAKERNMKELVSRTPIEIAGNLGYIPFYKDIRKVLLNYWYNAEEQIEKEKAKNDTKRKFGER